MDEKQGELVKEAANARRIVAAVNATEDISTSELENGIIGEMVKVMRDHVEAVRRTEREFFNGKSMRELGVQTYTERMERILARLKDGDDL